MDCVSFNNGTDIYLHPGNGSYSAIDLIVADPSLLLEFSWKVHDDLCGNDHFPIILESLNSTVGERPTRYKFDKVDWPLYEQMCRETLQTEMIRNATDPILKFNETVISIADETIPKTSPRQIQNTQVNHGLMMMAKTLSKIAERPNDGTENIIHRTTLVISASSVRKSIERKSAHFLV